MSKTNGNGNGKIVAQTIEQALVSRRKLLQEILPKHLTPDRIIKVALLARSRNPKLMTCTVDSLLKAVMAAAELGLEPSGAIGGAHLVPYDNRKTGVCEAQLIVDYRGLIELAKRSGDVLAIESHVIRDGDPYKVRLGLDPVLKHTPRLDGEQGEMVAVYAVARLKDGVCQFDVMSRQDVEKIRGRSRAGQSGPWVTDFEEMAKKTVVRRLCKYLPRSRELAKAIEVENETEGGDAPILDVDMADAEVIPTPKQLEPETQSRMEAIKARIAPQPQSQALPQHSRIIDVAPGESDEEAQQRAKAQGVVT